MTDENEFSIVNSILEDNIIKDINVDSKEETKISNLVENQFKIYSLLGALLSVAVYSLFNIISDSASYLAYYITYGSIEIGKENILTYIINIGLFLLTIIILMFVSSIDKKKMFHFASILIGFIMGGIIYFIKMKMVSTLYLSTNIFTFLLFIYTIPFILYYLSVLNNELEKSWLFSIGLFFLGLFTLLILVTISEWEVAISFIKENSLFTILWGVLIVIQIVYLILIKNKTIADELDAKIFQKTKYSVVLVKNQN